MYITISVFHKTKYPSYDLIYIIHNYIHWYVHCIRTVKRHDSHTKTQDTMEHCTLCTMWSPYSSARVSSLYSMQADMTCFLAHFTGLCGWQLLYKELHDELRKQSLSVEVRGHPGRLGLDLVSVSYFLSNCLIISKYPQWCLF